MTDASLITLFVRPLNQLHIPYMVTGGVASVVYGEPRFTRDIDLVIELRPRDVRRFAEAWSAADFYVPPVETIEEDTEQAPVLSDRQIGSPSSGYPPDAPHQRRSDESS